MSIRSLTSLAVERDKAAPGTAAKGGSGSSGDQTFADALTSAIPTEPLTAYTALLGIIVGLHTKHTSYQPVRWGAYGAFLLLIVVSSWVSFRIKTKDENTKPASPRDFPVKETLTALLAGASWGLVMPGSALSLRLSGTTSTVTAACITIGGSAVVALLSMGLTSASQTAPTPTPAA